MPTAAVNAQLAYFGVHPLPVIIIPPILFVLTAFALSLRIYVRGFISKALQLDDWLLLVAFASLTAECGIYMSYGGLMYTEGIAKPIDKLALLLLSAEVVYCVGQIFSKLSMAVFFSRIVNAKWQKMVITVTCSIFVLYMFAFFWICLFQDGTPTAAHFVAGDHSIAFKAIGPMNWAGGVLNILCDIIYVATPMFMVKSSMLNSRAKISVCVLIGLGALGSVASIARLPFIPDLISKRGKSYFEEVIPIGLLSLVEQALGIIAISLATLRPLFSSLLDHTTRRSNGNNGSSNRVSGLPRSGITRQTQVDVDVDVEGGSRGPSEDVLLQSDDEKKDAMETVNPVRL